MTFKLMWMKTGFKLVMKQEMFQKHICPPWCKIQVYLLRRSKTCPKQVIKIYEGKYKLGSKEWFDLDPWKTMAAAEIDALDAHTTNDEI